MFTGIIEEIGTVESVKSTGGSVRLRIHAPKSAAELHISDSVSINGVCQTVISQSHSSFEVEAVEETLRKTTLGMLKEGNPINLELPLKFNERLAGHMVLGHVDTIGTITKIEPRESSWMFTISFPPSFTRYIVPVGSVAIDGVSLTVAELEENQIRVSIIPHTREHTVFKFRREGDNVNIEFDIIGKYIGHLLERKPAEFNEKEFLSEKHLRELGF